jgi:hypothetical protein
MLLRPLHCRPVGARSHAATPPRCLKGCLEVAHLAFLFSVNPHPLLSPLISPFSINTLAMLVTNVLATLALPLLALAAPLEKKGGNSRFTWYDTEVGKGACGNFNENWKSEQIRSSPRPPHDSSLTIGHVALCRDGRPQHEGLQSLRRRLSFGRLWQEGVDLVQRKEAVGQGQYASVGPVPQRAR